MRRPTSSLLRFEITYISSRERQLISYLLLGTTIAISQMGNWMQRHDNHSLIRLSVRPAMWREGIAFSAAVFQFMTTFFRLQMTWNQPSDIHLSQTFITKSRDRSTLILFISMYSTPL